MREGGEVGIPQAEESCRREAYKTDDEWNFEKIFGRCNRFVKSAYQYH